ncbi:MAG: GXGXG motif-containing protein [Chloroflexota bacterium]
MAKLAERTLSGVHTETLAGRDHAAFYEAESESEDRFLYPYAHEVDIDKEGVIDAEGISETAVNLQIRAMMKEGIGHIIIKNPGAKHSMICGILNRLKITVEGSLGYFGCGLIDGPNVHIKGRVGWGCGENMMAGTIVIDKNAGSSFGAGLRGGDLVCRGDVGGRTGISMKAGTIIVGGRTGSLSGFMMQRGRMLILGNADDNLGDSMYDGTIYVGGSIKSLGIDAVPAELTDADITWLNRKLNMYSLDAPNGVENIQKIVAGKVLWNYDNLEPTEKKIVL